VIRHLLEFTWCVALYLLLYVATLLVASSALAQECWLWMS
jgi:hypothetical protein